MKFGQDSEDFICVKVEGDDGVFLKLLKGKARANPEAALAESVIKRSCWCGRPISCLQCPKQNNLQGTMIAILNIWMILVQM